MPHLHYTIAPEVFAHHPGYLRGVLVFDQLNNHAAADSLQPLLRQAEANARTAVQGNVADFPPVAAWREAYRRFGAKPSEHRSAIEALLRRVLKPDQLPQVNPLVDIGNLVSVQHLLPAGVHPLGAQGAALELRQARAGDEFMPTEGGAGEAVPAGEIVLARDSVVLTRRWTWRQAAGTRIEADTRCVFVNIDGLPPTGLDAVQAAMHTVQALVAQHCGGHLSASAVLSMQQAQLTAEYAA